MKASITTFPLGAAEGLPMLRVDFEGEAFDAEQVEVAKARHAAARGVWGIWLYDLGTWEDTNLEAWLGAEESRVICLRPMTAKDWPAAEISTVMDITAALEHADSIDDLADFVSQHALVMPAVLDAVGMIEGRAPLASALDLLAEFIGFEGQGYLYAVVDHRQRPLMLRAIAQCRSMWSLRSSP